MYCILESLYFQMSLQRALVDFASLLIILYNHIPVRIIPYCTQKPVSIWIY